MDVGDGVCGQEENRKTPVDFVEEDMEMVDVKEER